MTFGLVGCIGITWNQRLSWRSWEARNEGVLNSMIVYLCNFFFVLCSTETDNANQILICFAFAISVHVPVHDDRTSMMKVILKS